MSFNKGQIMGAISGEDLAKWEKMQGAGGNGREEKILVVVRLRPLSEKEIASNEASDWECINDTTVLYRNTLREGSTFPNAYSFDMVFRGDASTRQVYEGARDIALSVVNGINSSIFAYGQTGSGKTYTMNGITEYTVAEIFDYVQRHEERAFAVKFSAIEIYNEAVRDLLSSDNAPLRLLDDPDRGTIVEKLTEETLRDWNHLKELLSICEAQRQIGETSLNEKSSRSHQIIRLAIESSAREFLGKDNSTTLAASVSFIDLAGSERASQALSAGTRLKEGCHINRSLLTLGTVIRKLSKGRQGHINYRDSKLTRILQPSLGGNARTAIVCTLSPARSHVEQTRNTLLFACCAKEVTTKAQVNVVMSDKALVKHLQKELARLESELRTPGVPSTTLDYASLIRKKDLQIEKMEKEIRELKKQRDLAQSRVQDLLQMVGNDQPSRKGKDRKKLNSGDTWEDDGSLSESSNVVDPSSFSIRRYNNPHYGNNKDKARSPEESQRQENSNDDYLSDGTSSPRSIRKKFAESNSSPNQDNMAIDTDEDCKEVQCIEMEESRQHEDNSETPIALTSRGNEGTTALTPSPNTDMSGQANGFAYDLLAQRLNSLASPYPSMSSSRSLSLTRSWSCRANLMTDLSSPDKAERTPLTVFEKGFPGRPEGLGRKFPLMNLDSTQLSRNDSQSSFGSVSRAGEEDVTTLHSFVAGLKEMAKLEYQKQLVDGGQVQDTGSNVGNSVKEIGIGIDPILETPQEWPLEFDRQRRAILELWQACNVSLFHRTYFFLLFKGDPSDSIYMEVELRRLSFLKETYSHGNRAIGDAQTPTVAASLKTLRREREVLGKLMQRRLSEEERKRLFRQWGITLDSKRRRLQLANRLWSKADDIDHVKESAAIVAKLVRFVDQGRALKEMFGLSFTPASSVTKRRPFGWKNSRASLL